MTSMCVMCYVCLNRHFTEIKVQRETRSRCKQERNEWSHCLKTDSELFALSSLPSCFMLVPDGESTTAVHCPTSLFILVCLFCLTFFFWSWELCMVGRCDQTRQSKALLKDKIFRKLFCFLYGIYFGVSTQLHILWTLKLSGTFCSQELRSSAQRIRTFLDLHR